MQSQTKERWEIDTSRSQLRFTLRHIVVSEIQGLFSGWGGAMTVDPDRVPVIKVQAWIDVASIDTGAPERDAHVRSSEFLDTASFPRAQFTSTNVVLRKDGAATLTGRLELHGISRDLDLDVTAGATWIDDQGAMRAAYTARGSIDRQAFGLHWNQDLDIGGVVVGDRVEIEARGELVRTGYADFARPGPPRATDAGARPQQ
jgi:polyisoprenoid-binding protein YceI